MRIFFVLTLFFAGYGLLSLLLPGNLIKKYGFGFAPWFGTVFILLLGFIMNLSGMKMGLGYIVIITTALILLTFSILNNKKLPLFTAGSLIMMLLFIIAAFICSVFVDVNFTPIIKETFLFDYPLLDKVFKMKDVSFETYKIAPFIIIQFFSKLYKINMATAAEVIKPIYPALLFYPIYAFFNYFFKKNRICYLFSFIAFFLLIINYRIINYVFERTLFLGVAILFIILLWEYLSNTLKDKKSSLSFNNFDILLPVFLSSLLTIYPEVFKVILSLFLISIIYLFIKQKKITLFFIFVKIIFVTFIISPVMAGIALRIN